MNSNNHTYYDALHYAINLHNRYIEYRNKGVPFPGESIIAWVALLTIQRFEGIKGDLLELGVEHGGSAFLSLNALNDLESQFLVDLKISDRFTEKFNLLPANLSERVTFIEGSTGSKITDPLTDRRYRFIHIDAAHTYQAVAYDLDRYGRLLSPDGILCCDDFFTIRWPDVTTAILDGYEALGLSPLFLASRKIYLCKTDAKQDWTRRIARVSEICHLFGETKRWETTLRGESLASFHFIPNGNVGRTYLELTPADIGNESPWHDDYEYVGLLNKIDRAFNDARHRNTPLSARDPITKELERTYELILDALKPGLIVEVGAYEASFSMRMLQKHPEATVVAFEANPLVYDHFSARLLLNGLDYRNLAISDKSGTTSLRIPKIIAGNIMPEVGRMASLNELMLRDSVTESVTVHTNTLDASLFNLPSPSCVLWIDVEGAVDKVLDGAKDTLRRCIVAYLELESSPVWDQHALDSKIIKQMDDAGFVMVARDCQKWFQYNSIFIKRDLLNNLAVKVIIKNYLRSALDAWLSVCPDRLNLMQYWDKKTPPDEISQLMHAWATDKSFNYHLYDQDSAKEFIANHLPSRYSSAFQCCANPAMQADYFRLCWLLVLGGVYIDADIGNLETNSIFTECGARGYIFMRNNKVANDLMVFLAPEDPLVSRALEIATGNIESRMDGSVWEITGPSIMTTLYHSNTDAILFQGLKIDRVENLRKNVKFCWDLDYKKHSDHWTKVEIGCIYSVDAS